jgi:hypothetical protein
MEKMDNCPKEDMQDVRRAYFRDFLSSPGFREYLQDEVRFKQRLEEWTAVSKRRLIRLEKLPINSRARIQTQTVF